MSSARMDEALRIKDKLEKYNAIDELKEEVTNTFIEENEESMSEDELKELVAKVNMVLSDVEYKLFRSIVVKEGKRADGRKMDEIRPLSTVIDLLHRTHGSALFTRGETQALSVTTLGALNEHQIIDGLGMEDQKRFMLHYNFPQFSVGETGRYGSPGRREIGHGALGEKALARVIPSEKEFPYTIRVVSEILESNGSSSQASICAGCMSLMAAGVPIKAPVAGIAMGLITHEDDYTILTDIQGMEDHFGDMDFKVAGTKDGITALQMDIKVSGITEDIFREALAQAKTAREQILENMMSAINAPRKQVGKYAPKIEQFYIDPEKIREVIGPNGKMINKIIEESDNVKIDIEDDGHVVIYHMDYEAINKAATMIQDIVRVAKVGDVYDGQVVRIERFGAFVNLFAGTDGLCHISNIAHERIEKVEDKLKIGDTIKVKVMEIDEKGRVNVSAKALLPKPKKEERKPKEEA